ncbi:MAG: hypothetical protein QOJ94_1541 [Sphingomonadales bacterium]|nr:hypothetical protein [Sphingomonadales bacterium]
MPPRAPGLGRQATERVRATRLATIAFVSLIPLWLLGLLAISFIPEQPARPTRATVTGVDVTVTRYSVYAWIRLRAADGRIGGSGMLMDQLACRPGDVVEAEEVGVNLRLRGKACRRTPPSPWAADLPGRS